MIKLNAKVKGVFRYEPPIPVQQHFGDIDVSAPDDDQVQQLLWIPASLVSRFQYQYPHLQREADELFSVGLQKVVEVVAQREFDGNKIGAVCTVKCRKSMEDYANGLPSVVKVCTAQQYINYNKGVQTPTSLNIDGLSRSTTDDKTDLLLGDAAEHLGYDLTNLTRKQKNKLAECLGLDPKTRKRK